MAYGAGPQRPGQDLAADEGRRGVAHQVAPAVADHERADAQPGDREGPAVGRGRAGRSARRRQGRRCGWSRGPRCATGRGSRTRLPGGAGRRGRSPPWRRRRRRRRGRRAACSRKRRGSARAGTRSVVVGAAVSATTSTAEVVDPALVLPASSVSRTRGVKLPATAYTWVRPGRPGLGAAVAPVDGADQVVGVAEVVGRGQLGEVTPGSSGRSAEPPADGVRAGGRLAVAHRHGERVGRGVAGRVADGDDRAVERLGVAVVVADLGLLGRPRLRLETGVPGDGLGDAGQRREVVG